MPVININGHAVSMTIQELFEYEQLVDRDAQARLDRNPEAKAAVAAAVADTPSALSAPVVIEVPADKLPDIAVVPVTPSPATMPRKVTAPTRTKADQHREWTSGRLTSELANLGYLNTTSVQTTARLMAAFRDQYDENWVDAPTEDVDVFTWLTASSLRRSLLNAITTFAERIGGRSEHAIARWHIPSASAAMALYVQKHGRPALTNVMIALEDPTNSVRQQYEHEFKEFYAKTVAASDGRRTSKHDDRLALTWLLFNIIDEEIK